MASDPIQRMNEYLQSIGGAADQGRELLRDKLAAFEAASKNMVVEKDLVVPMRDGVHLSADVYRPTTGGPFPVLLARTPYGKAGPLTILGAIDIQRATEAGYAVILQDCRGRFDSEGEYYPFVNDASDGVDTVAWILQQPWANGRIGGIGGSYLGFTQWLLAKGQPAGLRALVPQMTTSDYYHAPCRHQGGVFELGGGLWWTLFMVPEEWQRQQRQGQASVDQMETIAQMIIDLSAHYEHLPLVDQPTLRQFASYYVDWLNHPTYDDYWRNLAHKSSYEQITAPALNIGGWYDIFLGPTLENYTGMKQRGGSETARKQQRLVIGPWSHAVSTGSFPERDYGPAANAEAVDLFELQQRWFDHWLKGEDNGMEQERPVKLFVMGLDQWREEDDWPLPDTRYRPYYLHSAGSANTAAGDGLLSPKMPADEVEDVYRYDPHNPVPTIGGATLMTVTDSGPRDQQAVEAREDVLCYSTPMLELPVEVTGPVTLVLYASSSARDTDFTGKLVDVYPDGRAEILTDGILRARYRKSFSEPRPLEPGQVYELRLDLWATSNLFKAGHRIRLEVSSSSFPRFDRNTNTGGVIETETEQDFVAAVNRIYHDAVHPSYVLLPIIERE